MENPIAINLKRARKLRGLTMEELADMINCSKQAISHYENGLRVPDSKILNRIAEALILDVDYFFEDVSVRFNLHSVNYREGMTLDSTQRQEIEVQASSVLNYYLELENIVNESILFQNPIGDLKINSTSDAELAAKQLRKKWKLGEEPLHNITNILERKGVRVVKMRFDFHYNHEGLSGWSEDRRIPLIVLNANQQDTSRIRFTILHELGHLLLVLDDTLDIDSIERICDTFAGAVLLPTEVLIREFGRNRTAITMEELRRIKELYGISIAAIMVRARMTDLISFDSYKRWKSSDFSNSDYGLYLGVEEPQRFNQMLYRCLSERKIGFDRAAKMANRSEIEFRELYRQQVTF